MPQNDIQDDKAPESRRGLGDNEVEKRNPRRNRLFRKILRASPCGSRFWIYPTILNPRKLQKVNILVEGYQKKCEVYTQAFNRLRAQPFSSPACALPRTTHATHWTAATDYPYVCYQREKAAMEPRLFLLSQTASYLKLRRLFIVRRPKRCCPRGYSWRTFRCCCPTGYCSPPILVERVRNTDRGRPDKWRRP